MTKELSIYQRLGRLLPNLPHITGLVNRILKPIYFRNSTKRNEKHCTDVLGFQMELEPFECVDGALFFYPHLYDCEEISSMKKILQPGDVFIDIGANVGIYTLIASKIVSDAGSVISIEADPYNFEKLQKNIRLNNMGNITALNIGVSDKTEVLKLGLSTNGNRGGNSFKFESENFAVVPCQSLIDILKELNFPHIKMIKMDIEGFEYKVLSHFLAQSNNPFLPDYIQLEHLHFENSENPVELLIAHGYHIIKSTSSNLILQKNQTGIHKHVT